MTPEIAMFITIEQHVEGCARLRRRLDWRGRRGLICRRWCKATGRSEAEYANVAAEWGAARIQAAMAQK